MPRNPAAKKNQHNNRHENGLVGPGKRVTKQKSNGHLNGNVKPALPDEPVPVVANLDSLPTSSASSSGYTASVETEPNSTLTKRNSDSSIDGQDQKWENLNGNVQTTPRRPKMAHIKIKSSQELNATQIVSTIVRSCPAGDTVALLIVLLALPSMLLTIVQALFASLTIMPSTGVSSTSELSLFDVFQGSSGSPSLGTMAIVDVMCFAGWIALWSWAQNFALDLAQIQIAMTLGNGNSGKSGTVNLFCFAIVLVLHSVRSSGVRRLFLSKLLPTSLLSHPNIVELAQFLPSESDFGQSPGAPSKIRSLFAIHILSQAFMAFVRRRVASTQAGSSAKSTRRTDTEAHAGSSNIAEQLDVDVAKANSTGPDYQPPPTPGLKDSKDKTVSVKKRRKQANSVKSRQPFWAALASRKVHVMREVENNNGHSNDNSDNQALLSESMHDVVRITNVEPTSIEFETTSLSSHNRDSDYQLSQDGKPIYVRINEAPWHYVSIEPSGKITTSRIQWVGTISGLAPDCTYTCSFHRDDDDEFASIMVKTPALQDRDFPPSLVPAPSRPSDRPNSPTTTLKKSIQTGEAKLADARARLTKTRRTLGKGVSRLEKEVATLNTRLNSSIDDTKQRQKLSQAERSIQQTEISVQEIATQLEELEAIPEDDVVDYDKKRSLFEEQSKLLSATNEALSAARSEAKNELSCVNNELNQIISRKDRLQGRQAKLAEQQDRITQANAQGMNEKERRAQESARIEADRQRRETELSDGINHMYGELQELQARTQNHWREIEALEKQAYAQRESMLKNSGPITPEGILPGTNPPQNRAFMFGPYQPSGLGMSETQSSPFLAFAKTLPSDTRRPRSNTNRSIGAISNFSADAFEDADPIPPMPSTVDFESIGANGRKGSGSSRGKNNGSPAGVIGDGLRGTQKGSYSPGNSQGVNSW